jgi:hypothetical protein
VYHTYHSWLERALTIRFHKIHSSNTLKATLVYLWNGQKDFSTLIMIFLANNRIPYATEETILRGIQEQGWSGGGKRI